MNIFWIILILILVLIYILSPIDGLPDMIPLLGWLDDTFLVGLFAYYLRYRRLPRFLLRLGRFLFGNRAEMPGSGSRSSSGQSYQRAGNSESRTMNGKNAPRDPYQILGVTPEASQEEIHAAYRAAAQQYHPDKVSHLGEEFQELAQKKFVEIQEAYHILTKKSS